MSEITGTSQTIGVYTFPCGEGANKGSREVLSGLLEQTLTVCFGGCLLSQAEAYAEARITQLAEIMHITGASSIQRVDIDLYYDSMIGTVSEWLEKGDQTKVIVH
ncbi:MAG: hypothetical protein ACI9SY_000215 [Candidatus Paceibacteria bacterium]|jgi:hypothetical protein